jgi:hypothetical protein
MAVLARVLRREFTMAPVRQGMAVKKAMRSDGILHDLWTGRPVRGALTVGAPFAAVQECERRTSGHSSITADRHGGGPLSPPATVNSPPLASQGAWEPCNDAELEALLNRQ